MVARSRRVVGPRRISAHLPTRVVVGTHWPRRGSQGQQARRIQAAATTQGDGEATMNREVRVGKGQSAVAISGALAGGLLDELKEAMGEGVYAVLDDEGRRLTESARATWPVKTGKSRDGLDYYIRIDPDGGKVEAVVGAGGDGRGIKSGQTRAGKKPL